MVNLPWKRSTRPMTELEQAVANGVSQNAIGRTSGDEEQKRNLAENFMLLSDPGVVTLLDGMSRYEWIDTDNVLRGNKNGVPEKYTGAIPKYVAARILNSTLLRSGYLSEKDAKIMILENHCIFIRVKMKLTEEEYEAGGAIVLDAIEQIVKSNILGSVNGRMAKLVKSRPSSYEVTVGPPGKGERNA